MAVTNSVASNAFDNRSSRTNDIGSIGFSNNSGIGDNGTNIGWEGGGDTGANRFIVRSSNGNMNNVNSSNTYICANINADTDVVYRSVYETRVSAEVLEQKVGQWDDVMRCYRTQQRQLQERARTFQQMHQLLHHSALDKYEEEGQDVDNVGYPLCPKALIAPKDNSLVGRDDPSLYEIQRRQLIAAKNRALQAKVASPHLHALEQQLLAAAGVDGKDSFYCNGGKGGGEQDGAEAESGSKRESLPPINQGTSGAEAPKKFAPYYTKLHGEGGVPVVGEEGEGGEKKSVEEPRTHATRYENKFFITQPVSGSPGSTPRSKTSLVASILSSVPPCASSSLSPSAPAVTSASPASPIVARGHTMIPVAPAGTPSSALFPSTTSHASLPSLPPFSTANTSPVYSSKVVEMRRTKEEVQRGCVKDAAMSALMSINASPELKSVISRIFANPAQAEAISKAEFDLREKRFEEERAKELRIQENKIQEEKIRMRKELARFRL